MIKNILFIPSSGSTLLNNLLSYWKLDETSGTRFDSTANNIDLTDINTVGSTAGKIGNAASFVAANDEELTSTSNGLDVGSSDFSVAFWFKLPTTPNALFAQVIGRRTFSVGWYFDLRSGTEPRLVLRNGSTASVDAGVNYNDDTWHFAVLTFDRDADMSIYIDDMATPKGSTSIIGITGIDTSFFAIGGRADTTGSNISGDVDEVGIWQRLLTAAERTQLWNSGSGLTYPFV
jgi:hypothetical protein